VALSVVRGSRNGTSRYEISVNCICVLATACSVMILFIKSKQIVSAARNSWQTVESPNFERAIARANDLCRVVARG